MFTLTSKTIWGHLARGVCGLTFLWIALHYAEEWGWWAAIPGLAALLCLRGCPMCWTLGLVMTIVEGGGKRCPDGSCETSLFGQGDR